MELIFNKETGKMEIKKILEIDYKNFDFSKKNFEEYLKKEVEKQKPHRVDERIFHSIYDFVLKKNKIEVDEDLKEKNEMFILNLKFIIEMVIKRKKREILFFEDIKGYIK